VGDKTLEYKTPEKPSPKRTRSLLVLVLVLLTPVILVGLMFLLVAFGFITPD